MTTKKQLQDQLTWYTSFTDYIENNHINIYNESCIYADKIERQELEDKFLEFPELEEEEEEEEEENNTCYECGEDIEQDERFCSKECFDNSFNERI